MTTWSAINNVITMIRTRRKETVKNTTERERTNGGGGGGGGGGGRDWGRRGKVTTTGGR